MKHLNLIGSGFSHAYSSSGWSKPQHLVWNKYPDTSSDISVHVDNAIIEIPVDKTKKNFSWIAESSAIVHNVVEWIKNNKQYIEENFIYLFTYDKSLLNITNNVKYVTPNWLPWVDFTLHEKTELCSMVASNKDITEWHRYRQTIIQKLSGQVKHYGWGYNVLQDKNLAFNNYMFSICLENFPYSLTEKVTDCFAKKTIPIMLGCKETMMENFNPDGVIMYTDDFKISDLSPELYYSKMDAINDNYERAKKLITTEDYFYLNYIKEND